MSRWQTHSPVKHLLFASFCSVFLSCSNEHGQSSRIPSNYSIQRDPITISMDESGGGLTSGEWHLSVNSAGEAQLTIRSQPTNQSLEFRVAPDEFEELRRLLASERFFELNDDYGEIVPDGGTQSITIVAGDHAHTVRLHFLMNWVHQDPARLVEPARAVRVGMLIRGWFQNEGAVDTRKYDQMVLDAAEKLVPK